MTATDDALALIATALGLAEDALDVFVFRRVDGGRFVQLGGRGRADGWAGVVEVHLDSEPMVAHAWRSDRPVTIAEAEPTLVFGPYWSPHAMIVPLLPDQLVVIGSDAAFARPHEDEMTVLAARVSATISAVSPAKRLADELKLLHAVRRATATAERDVVGVAHHVADAAAEALSCELCLVWLDDTATLAVADRRPTPTDARDHGALTALAQRLMTRPQNFPRCQQDNETNPLPPPLGVDSDVVAWFAVALTGAVDGLLVLCHTTKSKPRGFTLLCQQIGRQIAHAASGPLATAVAHDRLRTDLEDASHQARRDALTGLTNRLGWHEAIDELAHDRRQDRAAVVVLDVDYLKQVNDTCGHQIGDELLCRVATILRGVARASDMVARIGGDEFAVLLLGADEAVCVQVVERIRSELASSDPIGGLAPRASIGTATRDEVDAIDELQALADRRMYMVKDGREAPTA